MIHELTHLLGICGEKHFSALTILLDWQTLSPVVHYIKTVFK